VDSIRSCITRCRFLRRSSSINSVGLLISGTNFMLTLVALKFVFGVQALGVTVLTVPS